MFGIQGLEAGKACSRSFNAHLVRIQGVSKCCKALSFLFSGQGCLRLGEFDAKHRGIVRL